MKSQAEIEQVLERFANEWPLNDSIVDGVMRDIEADRPVLAESRSVGRWVMRSLFATAASVTVLVAAWWAMRGNDTLYAQVVDAIRLARTFKMTTTLEPRAGQPAQRVSESWYERGVGFRVELPPSVVRVGNQKNFWTYSKDSKLAIRSDSHGIESIVDQVLDNDTIQSLRDPEYKRYATGDQVIDGNHCRAFLLTTFPKEVQPDQHAGERRMVILTDERSRIVRTVIEIHSGDRWAPQLTTEWEYDVPIDREIFESHFDDDVKVVDADAAFDQFIDLEKAVHREERAGLIYAIHRMTPFEGGGILIVSSVRGTKETVKKYPLTQRRVQPGLYFVDGPAVNSMASPISDGYCKIDLASADHQGINVHWWVLVPSGTSPAKFDVISEKVLIPVRITPQGEYAKANHTDKRGVIQDLTWRVMIDLHQPNVVPTLDAIAGQVYADLFMLEAVPTRRLDMGPKGGVNQYSEVGKTTAVEFGKAVAEHIAYWQAMVGAAPPK